MGSFILVACWLALIIVVGLGLNLVTGCAYDGNKDRWKHCGGVHHMVCEGDLNCEYEFYKECILDGAAPPDAR